MIKIWLVLFGFLPVFLLGQSDNGKFSVGGQFYQNLLLPDFYEGSGIGLNWQVGFKHGIALDAMYMFETNDLLNAGSIKRFQRGLGVNYSPLYQKTISPWVQVGVAFNTLTVSPVSYLFSDKSDKVIEQSYFSLNIGLGGYYKVNKNLKVNLGFYFQPQNYSPDYVLEVGEGKSILNTSHKALNLPVDPLLYFNLGITYQILNLW